MAFNTRSIGSKYEDMAVDYLIKKGHRILDRNYNCRYGEIDIISKHQDSLVFIEVKYRKKADCGYAEEAVDIRKQKQISRASLFYLNYHGYGTDIPIRYDVISISDDNINHIENAFYYTGNNTVF